MGSVKSKKRLYLMIALVSVLLMWSFCGTNTPNDGGDLAHLLDRPWVAKMTDNPKEMNHALVFLRRESIGASINGSAYQHMITVVRHKEKGNKITVELLQAGKRFTTIARTYECKGPKGLDLCLDLGPRVKQVRLFSSSRWRIGEEGTPTFGVEQIEMPESIGTLQDVDDVTGLGLLPL